MKVIKKIFSLMLVFLVGFALTLPAGASDKVDPKDNPEIDLSKTTGSITIHKLIHHLIHEYKTNHLFLNLLN